MSSTERIRELNDALRTAPPGYFRRVYMTRGVAALPPAQQAEIMKRVREYDAFTDGNDPHGEHDFGSFEHAGPTIFWKIDYYDAQFAGHSPDPADERVTTRVLTVMLAEEY